ncbi:MAG: hypothetical protein AB1805_11815, partial [Nitrospirota bacterium]
MPITIDTHSERLIGELIKNLRLNFFDNQDIIGIIDAVDTFDERLRLKVLVLCVILSDETPSIIPSTLRRIQKVGRKLDAADLEKWIDSAAEILNGQGTDAFFRFVSRTDEEHLKAFAGVDRLRFKEVATTIELYLKGISGSDLAVGTDIESSTDIDTVYFPAVLSRFKRADDNLLVYLLMAAHKWAQIATGTLTPDLGLALAGTPFAGEEDAPEDLEALFNLFPERELAIDLFTLLEAFMLDAFLWRELPGLMERSASLKKEIFDERPALNEVSEKTSFSEGVYHLYLAGRTKGPAPDALARLTPEILGLRQAESPAEIIRTLITCYAAAQALDGLYEPHRPVFFLGTVKPERIVRRLRARRNEMRKKVERMISTLLNMPKRDLRQRPAGKRILQERPVKPEQEYLVIKGRTVAIDKDLQEKIKGGAVIPEGALVKGSTLESGSSYIMLEDLVTEEELARVRHGGIAYDEWDYHRGDYKKAWCILYEQDVEAGDEPFVETTMKHYRRQVAVLKKKFERIKTGQQRAKKQGDGDMIDLDAAVEALSDLHAGLVPEENIYTRTQREKRDIAVLFLIDMSGSTKGWVNEAEKEALVLMCEALEALGDRYAIYG